jgi:hypothetical protein
MAREEVLRVFLDSAVAPESTPYFAYRAITCALYSAKPEDLMIIVANREFLVRQNFACVFVIFRHFILQVARKRGGDLLEFCQMLQSEEAAVFPDELRKKAIAAIDDPGSVAIVLHEYQFT